jgi:hypothetical protein
MSDGNQLESLDKPPPISAEQRSKILSDPNVAKIAAELQMPIEEFVNTVGYYINNPGVEPAFLVVSDENLKKMGVTPPTAEAIEANVRASVEAIKAGTGPSGFDQAKKVAVALPKDGGEAATGTADPDLEDTVKKARIPRKS